MYIAVVTLQRHGDDKKEEGFFGFELFLLKESMDNILGIHQKGFVGFFGRRNLETDLQEYSFAILLLL